MSKKSKTKVAKELPKKCIVQTKNDLTLLNTTLEAIHHNRPTLTTMTSFIEDKMQAGEIMVLARHLPNEANDVDFKECYKSAEKDVKLAVSVYCSEFNLDPDGEELDA